MKNSIIYSTSASAYFAELIAQSLGAKLGGIERFAFSDGELYHRLAISDASELGGKTALIVASTNTDADFNELEKIGHTLADAGTARRIFIIPFFGYSTMERAVLPGEMVSAKINARRLSNLPRAGENVFLTLDLHSSGILHYFEGDCSRHELCAEKVLERGISELKLANIIFGTADLGKTKWADSFAEKFSTDLAFIRKSRVRAKTKVNDVIGEVAGKNVVIYDDMTRSGGTLIQAARAYLDKGAAGVYAVLSHLALSNERVIKLLEKSPIKKIIATNSHPMSQHKLVKRSKKISIIDVSPEFVKIIKKLI